MGKTALESAVNNTETLNAPHQSSAHSNSSAPQESNQSSQPQNQPISDSQYHQNAPQNVAESSESKNQSHHSLSRHATDHTTEDTFSSEDNSGWSNSSQAQRRVRKSVVARNSIRQSLGNFRELINLQGKPNGIPGQISPSINQSTLPYSFISIYQLACSFFIPLLHGCMKKSIFF